MAALLFAAAVSSRPTNRLLLLPGRRGDGMAGVLALV